MKEKAKRNPLLQYNMVRSDWGNVKPYTRVESDRTKYSRKTKHKKSIDSEN
jgi:hypothetical protein